MERTLFKGHEEFPTNMKNRAYAIYPKKGVVVIDGYRRFSLKKLKKINHNIRLGFPHDLFVAIHQA